MAAPAEQPDREVVTPQLLAAMRQGEADREWLDGNPDVLEPYRGEWVVVYKAVVVAHSPDGREVARQASVRRYPGSTLLYVPSRDEASGIRIGPFR